MRFKKASSSVLSVVRNIVSLNQKDLIDQKLNVSDPEKFLSFYFTI
jgi:hypothetical protein